MIRRIFLFALTNIAIIFMGSIIFWILQKYFGINITGTLHTSWFSLAIFAVVYWFIASFISLFLSKWMAKRFYKMVILDPENRHMFSPSEKLVYQTIEMISQSHSIRTPEIGIYDSREVNAFATGATKNSSLVWVSRGLIENMKPDEIEGVIAHEMAHILNGDMVTMTLLQWVINAFVIFLSRALAQIISQLIRKDDEGPGFSYFIISIFFEIILWFLWTILVMAYSRRREFAADLWSASFVGKNKMIAALQALSKIHDTNVAIPGDPKLSALKIDWKTQWFMRLFASHPTLEDRIEKLKNSY